MKKVAIPVRNGQIEDHFGQAENYLIYSIDNNNVITDIENFEAPQGCGCKSGVAKLLFEKGVNNMLSGNMGMGALNVLNHYGINVIRGCQGEPAEVINLWLKNELKDSGESCHSHESCEN